MAFELPKTSASSLSYPALLASARSLLEGESDFIANLANVSALLFHALPNVNWVGFYLWKDGELVLGPFQGKPACTRIALGRGVCGTAALRRVNLVVDDVSQFQDHIVCDSDSRSEMVLPLLVDGALIGVLDIDSPQKARFTPDDEQGLSPLVALLSQHLKR